MVTTQKYTTIPKPRQQGTLKSLFLIKQDTQGILRRVCEDDIQKEKTFYSKEYTTSLNAIVT